MSSQILIIVSFFLLLVFCFVAAAAGIIEAKNAMPWIAGAFVSELAHMARKSAE